MLNKINAIKTDVYSNRSELIMNRYLVIAYVVISLIIVLAFSAGGYSVSGCFMNIVGDVNLSVESIPLAMDVAFFIPLNRYLPLPDTVKDLKLGLGLFNPVTNSTIDPGKFIPTYSIDIKFGRKK